MVNNNFCHLHVHTEYSIQDGLSKIPTLVKRVKELGMTSCAITDHGVGYGLVEFYNACKKEGIKPILGCEVYMAPGSRFEKSKDSGDKAYSHLILLVKNEIGYKNLCILISRSNTEGFYYKPRIDFELLKEHHEGLICLSACIAGELPQAIIHENYEKVEEIIKKYQDLFGQDYYFEIQNHGIREEQLVATELVKYSRKYGIKLVCTNDSHYVYSEDKEAHEWLLCLQTGKTMDDPGRLVYHGNYSIKSEADMRALFPSLPEAFDNTMEISDKCNFEFKFGEYRMPTVHIPEEYGTDFFRYLSDEAWKGYEWRYPEGHPEREQARKNLEYELSVINQMGFAEYFLDTRKTVLYAKDHGIPVGPGRGSAAGSTMCYCLNITDIDPIRYGLLFERFLNPERISMPDIDVDYSYNYKDAIVAFEAESNGKDHFAKIQTFGRMKAKGVLRNCARIAGYSPSIGDTFAKMIPNEINMTLAKAYDVNPDLKRYLEENPEYEKLWDIAKKLEGTIKSVGTHACGHIPTPVPCEELFPVSVDQSSDYLVCQYNMVEAEHLGNLKKDLLMLRNLTVIDIAHRLIKERHGITIPYWTEEILNDKETLKMISRGETDGVFQLESSGMKSFMKELKPDCFEDIIAGVSLYRPGPMDFIPKYIKGKQDPSNVTYKTPMLKPILEATYGCIVYQEQVMQIVRSLAGFSMGRADLVRKAMSKKQEAVMQEEGQHFIYGDEELQIKGCIHNQIAEETAISIYSDMSDFAKYAFNKSHAACYAAIAMQTGFLACHYFIEFMAGLLSSVMDSVEKLILYLNICRQRNLKVLPPNINRSNKEFSIEGGCLRYGMMAIKGIGGNILNTLMEERTANGEYKSITDLINRNPGIKKNEMEALIYSGSLDCFKFNRHTLIESYPNILSGIKSERKTQIEGQISLFDFVEEEPKENMIEVPEYDQRTVLDKEKESIGFYVSGHPLDEYNQYIEKKVSTYAFDIAMDEEEENDEGQMNEPASNKASLLALNEQTATMVGLCTVAKKIFTKKSNRPMMFLTMEDMTGSFDVVVFPDTFEKFASILKEGSRLSIKGKLSIDDAKSSLIAEDIIDLDTAPRTIWIRLKSREQNLSEVQYIKGICAKPSIKHDMVKIYYSEEKVTDLAAWSNNKEIMDSLYKRFPKEDVKITI